VRRLAIEKVWPSFVVVDSAFDRETHAFTLSTESTITARSGTLYIYVEPTSSTSAIVDDVDAFRCSGPINNGSAPSHEAGPCFHLNAEVRVSHISPPLKTLCQLARFDVQTTAHRPRIHIAMELRESPAGCFIRPRAEHICLVIPVLA